MKQIKLLVLFLLFSIGICKAQDFSTNFSWVNTSSANTSSTTVDPCDDRDVIEITLTTSTGHIPFNNSEVLFPLNSTTNSTDLTVAVNISFSQPVSNLELKLRDLDVGDYNTPPSETCTAITPPASSVMPVEGSLTFILVDENTAIDPNNQRDTDGWIQWGDQPITSVSFDYNRLGGMGIRLDSLRFDCVTHTDINEYTEANIKLNISPNPVSEELSIKLPNSMVGGELSILSIDGEVVISQKVTSSYLRVDVSGLRSGIYIANCIKYSQVHNGKFIKK